MKNGYEVDRDCRKRHQSRWTNTYKGAETEDAVSEPGWGVAIVAEAGGVAGTRAQGRRLQITEDAGHWAEASALHRGGPGGAAPSPNVADI